MKTFFVEHNAIMYQFSKVLFQCPPPSAPANFEASPPGGLDLNVLALTLKETLEMNDEAYQNLATHLERHAGEEAVFSEKAGLRRLLAYLLNALIQEKNASKKMSMALAITTDIALCTNGFFNRIGALYLTQMHSTTLEDWLHDLRVELVERAARLVSDDVHTHNRFFYRAAIHFGVRPIAHDDAFQGDIPDGFIDYDLNTLFYRHHQPLNVIHQITERFSQMLLDMGLQNLIDNRQYDQQIISEISEKMAAFLGLTDHPVTDFIDMDEETLCPLRLKKIALQKIIYIALAERGYLIETPQDRPLIFSFLENTLDDDAFYHLCSQLAPASLYLIYDIFQRVKPESDLKKLKIIQAATQHLPPEQVTLLIGLLAHQFERFESLTEHFTPVLTQQFFSNPFWGERCLHQHYRRKEVYSFCLKMILHYEAYPFLFAISASSETTLSILAHFPSTLEYCLPLICQIPMPHLEHLIMLPLIDSPNWILHSFISEEYAATTLEKFFGALTVETLTKAIRPVLDSHHVEPHAFFEQINTTKLSLFFNLCFKTSLAEPIMQIEFEDERTIFHCVALIGNVEIMRKFLQLQRDLINVQDIEGQTPLHIALSQEDEVMAQILIAHGAEINIEDNQGQSPMTIALSLNNPRLLEILESTSVCPSSAGEVRFFRAPARPSPEEELAPTRHP